MFLRRFFSLRSVAESTMPFLVDDQTERFLVGDVFGSSAETMSMQLIIAAVGALQFHSTPLSIPFHSTRSLWCRLVGELPHFHPTLFQSIPFHFTILFH